MDPRLTRVLALELGERPGKVIREMRPNKLPPELRNFGIILGFEGDGENQNQEENEEENEEEEEKNEDGGNVEGLKSALAKERKERRRLAKEVKALSEFRKEREDAEKTDVDKAKDNATQAEAKAQKLAARLKDTALDNAIIQLAGSMGFADVDDALRLIDRDAVDVDQDEDDPSDVSIDKATVKSALETLKKAKPHLIKSEEAKPGSNRTGSRFNGVNKEVNDKDAEEAALRQKYPALRRGLPAQT